MEVKVNEVTSFKSNMNGTDGGNIVNGIADDSTNYQGKTGYVVISANGTEYAREEFTFEQ